MARRAAAPGTAGHRGCLHCGQHHRPLPLAAGEVATCARCGATLYRGRHHGGHGGTLALTITGLVLLGLSHGFPLLSLRTRGVQTALTLLDACLAFWHQDQLALALLVALTIVGAPLLELGALLVVLLLLQLGVRLREAAVLFRWVLRIREWSLSGVFLLGLLVALVKLGDLATVTVGPALWCLCGLILVLAVIRATADTPSIWIRLGAGGGS